MHKRSLGMSVYRFLGNPPRGIPGYGFPAAGTSALLAFPDSDNRVSASRRLEHQAGFPPLEILPPFRIIGIGITFQLCITGNLVSVSHLIGNSSILPSLSKGAAKTHVLPRCLWKYFSTTHHFPFAGCRRSDHCKSFW